MYVRHVLVTLIFMFGDSNGNEAVGVCLLAALNLIDIASFIQPNIIEFALEKVSQTCTQAFGDYLTLQSGCILQP